MVCSVNISQYQSWFKIQDIDQAVLQSLTLATALTSSITVGGSTQKIVIVVFNLASSY